MCEGSIADPCPCIYPPVNLHITRLMYTPPGPSAHTPVHLHIPSRSICTSPGPSAHPQVFFEAVADDAADKYGDAILNLSRTQPYLPSREAFKREVREKCERQKREFNNGGGRAGQVRAC